MSDELRRPLTARERSVADLIGRGLSYKQVAAKLELGRGDLLAGAEYVRCVTMRIADLLPAPDAEEISPRSRVMLWAAHQRWLQDFRATVNA